MVCYNGAAMRTGGRITMKKWLVAVIVTAPALLATGCGRGPAASGGRMLVAASIAPMYDFSRQVGGRYVEVEMLVPPGANPHTYQLEPDQMRTLSQASVLVLNGLGLEYWASKAVEAAANPDLIVVKTARGIKPIAAPDEGEGGNPHVWLDPVLAIRQVNAIRDAFTKADPAHAKAYRANAAAYVAKLRALDNDIRTTVATLKSKSFISAHPSWVYFAREYGLREVASIDESPGKEPSPTRIRNVIDAARRIGAKAIFAEPQTSAKAAQAVASEVGAKVVILNPMGDPPSYSYIQTMRENLKQVTRALRQ